MRTQRSRRALLLQKRMRRGEGNGRGSEAGHINARRRRLISEDEVVGREGKRGSTSAKPQQRRNSAETVKIKTEEIKESGEGTLCCLFLFLLSLSFPLAFGAKIRIRVGARRQRRRCEETMGGYLRSQPAVATL